MSIKRGVSLYSYQQSQFFKKLDLWQQIREVRENLGTDGIEIISQQAIKRYPFPSNEWLDKWHATMSEYNMKPAAYDAHLDVLQFRYHVMDYDECAERLKRDLRLAKRLGFDTVRVHSSHRMEILLKAVPVAEELGMVMAKEIHAPMSLTGPETTEIVEYAEKTGTKTLGIYPDFSIFQVRIQKPVADWYIRQGCTEGDIALAQRVCDERIFENIIGNLRDFETQNYYNAYVTTGEMAKDTPGLLAKKLIEYTDFVKANLEGEPTKLLWDLFGWPLKMRVCTGDQLVEYGKYVTGCHGKFYDMTEIPNRPGEYEDISIDNETAIRALKSIDWDGYINSENEGQRHYHDLDREFYQDEIEQARRHHKMMQRIIGE